MDWSPAEFDTYQAIYDRWQQVEPGTSGKSRHIAQMFRFRASMRKGDIVIVSDGISRFRAIGEIVSEYQYVHQGRDWNHRRAVRWLTVLDESLPVDTIYDGRFSMASCYLLKTEKIKKDALKRLLPSEAGNSNGVPDQFVLIIDEINRANISKVFGELITLIEPDKRLGAPNALTVRLPYSGDSFGVPMNLHVIGTMNTADRSIALLDTALRRRFEFRELMPEPELLEEAGRRTGVDIATFLRVLNERIEFLFDREHQIGHAYFIDCQSRKDIDTVMRTKVIPLLQEYFFEDWGKIALVLGDTASNGSDGNFLKRQELKPPAGMGDGEAEPRTRWTVKETFAPNAYTFD